MLGADRIAQQQNPHSPKGARGAYVARSPLIFSLAPLMEGAGVRGVFACYQHEVTS